MSRNKDRRRSSALYTEPVLEPDQQFTPTFVHTQRDGTLQSDTFDHPGAPSCPQQTTSEDADQEMDSTESTNSASGTPYPQGQTAPHHKPLSSRRPSAVSTGPQYRYINGQRYVREDCLYNTANDYTQDRRGSAASGATPAVGGHNGGTPGTGYQTTGPSGPGQHPRHYQTYNYVEVDDDQESMQDTHEVTNRRRSEPIQGHHWQQQQKQQHPAARKPQEPQFTDMFMYQHHRPKPVLYENIEHHRRPRDWISSDHRQQSRYPAHMIIDPGILPMQSPMQSPYRGPQRYEDRRSSYRSSNMPYTAPDYRHQDMYPEHHQGYYMDESSLMANVDDSSLYLEDGQFPAPNNTVETVETLDNSMWEVTRPEFIAPDIPMKQPMYAASMHPPGPYSRPQPSMKRVPTIDSSLGNISAITRTSRLSLCKVIGDDTDMSMDIQTPQHSTPEKDKVILGERNNNTPVSPCKNTPPIVISSKDTCSDMRPDPLGRADDSIPRAKKKSISSSSHSDNSSNSKDSHNSWGEPASSSRRQVSRSREREHKSSRRSSSHHQQQISAHRQPPSSAHRHQQQENMVESNDGYGRRRHYSDSGNHSGSGGEYYTSSEQPREYNGGLAKRSYSSSMGTGSAGSHESVSSVNSVQHQHYPSQYAHHVTTRTKRVSGGSRPRRRSSNHLEPPSIPLYSHRNVVSDAAGFPMGPPMGPPSARSSKVKLYSSSQSRSSGMNPVHTMIRKREFSDLCPDASMLTQCNNESWNDRDLMTSILSMNSSLDCEVVYGYGTNDWEQTSSVPSNYHPGMHAPMNTPESSETSWKIPVPSGNLQSIPSVSSQDLASLPPPTSHRGPPISSHQHYYSKVPNISTVPEEEEVENFYMDLENIPEEMENYEEDLPSNENQPPLHTTIDSDCTTFMEGRGCINRAVTGNNVKSRGRRTSIAKKLKKVGKHIHQIGHQKLQLKTLAHL